MMIWDVLTNFLVSFIRICRKKGKDKIEVYNGKDLLSDDVYEIVGYSIYNKNGYRKSNKKYHYNKKKIF